jgi:hypothetical protein
MRAPKHLNVQPSQAVPGACTTCHGAALQKRAGNSTRKLYETGGGVTFCSRAAAEIRAGRLDGWLHVGGVRVRRELLRHEFFLPKQGGCREAMLQRRGLNAPSNQTAALRGQCDTADGGGCLWLQRCCRQQ